MAEEPDLMAELDDAERIISGGVEKVVTEWGHREASGHIFPVPSESFARSATKCGCPVVKRKITYGAWQDA